MRILWSLALLALFWEYIGSALGLGYGTALMPVLLMTRCHPSQILPSVQLLHSLASILAGILYHACGNVTFEPGSRPLRAAVILAASGVVGTAMAVFILIVAQAPHWTLTTYSGLLVLAIGITILGSAGRDAGSSWKKVAAVGLMAAFNKGLSGGGYGPLASGGLVLAGVRGKEAVGAMSLAEGLTCAVGLASYMLTGSGRVDWELVPSLALGSILSVPLAVLSVKRMPVGKMRWVIGSAVTASGLFTLLRLYGCA
jgi:uncharacterized membrane protein YfcA